MTHIPFMPGIWTNHATPSDPGARAAADRAKSQAESLEQRLDRALLTMEAMWTILCEKLEVTPEQLAERIVEIDMSDGRLDGKVRRPPAECPSCSRTIPVRFARCLYCGDDVPHNPFA